MVWAESIACAKTYAQTSMKNVRTATGSVWLEATLCVRHGMRDKAGEDVGHIFNIIFQDKGKFPFYFIDFIFLPHRAACGISVLQPGTEPGPTAVRAPSPDDWTTREVPRSFHFKMFLEMFQLYHLLLFAKINCFSNINF